MNPTFEDMPRLMAELIKSNQDLKNELLTIKNKLLQQKEKGVILKGYREIAKHRKINEKEIPKLIAAGAPIYHIGNSFQCYSNELDEFIAKNNRVIV